MELGTTANVSERRQSWLQFTFGFGSVKMSKLYLNYNAVVYEEALLYVLTEPDVNQHTTNDHGPTRYTTKPNRAVPR